MFGENKATKARLASEASEAILTMTAKICRYWISINHWSFDPLVNLESIYFWVKFHRFSRWHSKVITSRLYINTGAHEYFISLLIDIYLNWKKSPWSPWGDNNVFVLLTYHYSQKLLNFITNMVLARLCHWNGNWETRTKIKGKHTHML